MNAFAATCAAVLVVAAAAFACEDATNTTPPSSGTSGVLGSSSGDTSSGGLPGDSGSTNTEEAGSDPGDRLAPLSDEFNGPTLSPDWLVFRGALTGITIESGAAQFYLRYQSLWFNAGTGPALVKSVTGDFIVTSRVHVRRAFPADAPLVNLVHLAGLGARNVAGPPENHLFIVLGNDENDLSVETKTTTNGVSSYAGPSWPAGDAELRICRRGSVFRLYKRMIGAPTFTEAASYTRIDLPETLQVGPLLYANTEPADLIARFDEVTFRTPSSDDDCAR